MLWDDSKPKKGNLQEFVLMPDSVGFCTVMPKHAKTNTVAKATERLAGLRQTKQGIQFNAIKVHVEKYLAHTHPPSLD